MGHFIDVRDVSKTFRVSKRSSGVLGMLMNLAAPKYEKKSSTKCKFFY